MTVILGFQFLVTTDLSKVVKTLHHHSKFDFMTVFLYLLANRDYRVYRHSYSSTMVQLSTVYHFIVIVKIMFVTAHALKSSPHRLIRLARSLAASLFLSTNMYIKYVLVSRRASERREEVQRKHRIRALGRGDRS